MTGNPRGFAFVSFSDASALNRVLANTHTILGRMVEVKKAVPRSQQNQYLHEHNQGQNSYFRTNGSNSNDMNRRTKKIFVGGSSAKLTEDDFKFYFEKFGCINDVVVVHDNVTHQPCGFGFITIETEDSVEDVRQKNFHELNGRCPYSPRYDVVPSLTPVINIHIVPGTTLSQVMRRSQDTLVILMACLRVVIRLVAMGWARFHQGFHGAHCRCHFIQLTETVDTG